MRNRILSPGPAAKERLPLCARLVHFREDSIDGLGKPGRKFSFDEAKGGDGERRIFQRRVQASRPALPCFVSAAALSAPSPVDARARQAEMVRP